MSGNLIKSNTMKNFTKLILLSLVTLFSSNVFANHLTGNMLFSARFSGAQEVPMVSTEATGVGGFFLNANRDSLCITISVVGLSGDITGAHIHEGLPGENGDVLLNFTDNIEGNRIVASITGADLTGELIARMYKGELYFNIHTEDNPAGEIRGQIVPEADSAFHASLDADQEVEDIMSDATGLASFNLSKTGMQVNYTVVVDGLSGAITGAHLHNAPAGMNGDVIVNLTDDVDGNLISGSFNPQDFPGLLEAMEMDEIYINVHTAANASGEIRGQLTLERRISQDAVLNTAQEIPMPTGADGNGLAWASLNYTMDTLFYKVQVEGLTGAITGAHFHNAPFGSNGDVVYNLTPNVDGNIIAGFIAGAELTQDNINLFLSGAMYLNIHTDMNAAGEIRGQVYKLLREGYTLNLSGDQEVPSVETDASGSGIVSINRDQTNAHFMIAYNDLSGPQSMAHFHSAPSGQNGDVIFNLSTYFSQVDTYDAAFGYWTEENDTPFDPAAALAFREGEVYINVHSSANPSGELRGQVSRELICSDMSVGIFEIPERTALTVFPNPTVDQVNIDFKEIPQGNYTFSVSDITGKIVRTERIVSNGTGVENFDVSSLKPGVYVISIAGESTIYTSRLVRK